MATASSCTKTLRKSEKTYVNPALFPLCPDTYETQQQDALQYQEIRLFCIGCLRRREQSPGRNRDNSEVVAMITVRPGSHMYQVLRLLSVSGEFPSSSLGILGDSRTVKAMIHKMEAVQNIKLSSSGSILTSRLFQISGKGNYRTVRLNKNALAVLNEIHPDALSSYLALYPDNRFTGDRMRIGRNHRVGEALAMCMMAEIEFAPYILPELQKRTILPAKPKTSAYYLARNFKKIYEAELNKTVFTRVVGLLLHPSGSYAVYNTRNAAMKWSGLGELKARQELSEIVRMNAGQSEISSAILFGSNQGVALQTLIESDRSREKQVRFDRIYQNIHFIPMDQNGISLLKLLASPDWHENLMGALFNLNMRPTGFGSIEYDAYWDSTYYYSHIDSDIARLIRFSEALKSQNKPFEVLCLNWQVEFLKKYLGSAVRLRQLDIEIIFKALGMK